jgi:hypothetical protein
MDGDSWQSRRNTKVYELLKEPGIVRKINAKEVRCLGNYDNY